jgi:site-specific DNA recombinase
MKRQAELVRAAIYARVSTDQQAEAGTITSQIEALTKRLRDDGLSLDEELSFVDEGYSGSTLVRPALERLRDAAASGAVDRLYVHSPDRLARNYAYQVLLVDELHRCGVELVFLNRALGQSPEDDLLLQVQGMVAEYERAKILERSRRGRLHAARRGSVSALSAAPYGYRYVRKQEGGGEARYDIVWEEARVVRQLFAWVGVERCSLGEVCRRLRRQGVTSPTGRGRWDRSTVWGILRNPAYQGTAYYGKTQAGPLRPRLRSPRGKPEQPRHACSRYDSVANAVAIPVPALVSAELFAAVAEQLAENRQRHRVHKEGARYLLQGLVVCRHCGYALYGKPVSHTSTKGKKRRYVYYRCIGTDAFRSGGQRTCANQPVRTDRLEEAVWQDVCALLSDPEKVAAEYQRRLNGTSREDQRASSASLTALMQRVKRGIARLIDAYGEGLVDKSEFEPRIRSARERLSRLQSEAQAQAEAQTQEQEVRLLIGHLQEFAQRVQSGLHEADWSTRRDIIRALVKRVEVDKEATRVVYRVSPLPFVESPGGGIWQDCWGRKRGPLTRPKRSITCVRLPKAESRESSRPAAPEGSVVLPAYGIVLSLFPGLQLLPPLRRLVLSTRRLVKLHQPPEGLGQTGAGAGRDLRLTPLHPFIPAQQERLGFGVLLLAQQRRSQQ